VGKFIYPVDFIVFKTERVVNAANQIPVILRCPFLAITNALINYRNGMIRLSFDDMTLKLNIFNMQRWHSGFDDIETSTLNWVEDFIFDDEFDEMFIAEYELFFINDKLESDVFQFDELCSIFECVISSTFESLKSDSPFASLDLKSLPNSLKYSCLGPDDSLPVIIASDSYRDQEEKLIDLLRDNKGVIGWTLADIKGSSPSIIQHKIHLEKNAKPYRDYQRRLNPTLHKIVPKEVLILLTRAIIYPISDNEWVSPIQVVSKKIGITVIRNDKNELVLTRVQSG